MEVWIATCAPSDDTNASGPEIIGVFSTEEKALEAARAVGPRTGDAERATLDEPLFSVADPS